MQEATRIEIRPSSDNAGSLSRNLHNLRGIVPALLYLGSYAVFAYGMQWSGSSGFLSNYSLTAGFNLALLLIR